MCQCSSASVPLYLALRICICFFPRRPCPNLRLMVSVNVSVCLPRSLLVCLSLPIHLCHAVSAWHLSFGSLSLRLCVSLRLLPVAACLSAFGLPLSSNLRFCVSGHFVLLLQQFGADGFALEHRFYGASKPLPSSEPSNLRWLTAEQVKCEGLGFAV